jgi:hypothetical protein
VFATLGVRGEKMEGNLARKLKSFYERHNNRILFQRGSGRRIKIRSRDATLTQVALEMAVRLGSQIDEGVLSRVLSGDRLFTPMQLMVFCEVLGLSEADLYELLKALEQDYRQRRMQTHALHYRLSYLALVEIILKDSIKIKSVLTKGDPHLAADLAAGATEKIIAALQSPALRSSQEYEAVLKLLGNMVALEGLARREYLSRNEVVPVTESIVREMHEIAMEAHDEALSGAADYAHADRLYIRGERADYIAALPLFGRAFELVRDEGIRYMALRGKMRCHMYVEDVGGFTRVFSLVKELINDGQVPAYHASRLLEGAVPGCRLLLRDPDGGRALLEQAAGWSKTLEDLGQGAPFLQTQQDRTLLEHIASIRSTDSKGELERLGRPAIKRARQLGYFRHAMDMEKILLREKIPLT